MKRGEWHDEARRLRAEHPEWSNGDIARAVGVTRSAVWNLFDPNRTERMRRQNAVSNARKRAWERSERGRGRCAECGGLKGPGSASRESRLCGECLFDAYHARIAEMVRLRYAGVTNREIAAQLGATTCAVTTVLSRAKKRDPSIPRGPYSKRRSMGA